MYDMMQHWYWRLPQMYRQISTCEVITTNDKVKVISNTFVQTDTAAITDWLTTAVTDWCYWFYSALFYSSLLWLVVDRMRNWSTHFTTASVWKLLCAYSMWPIRSEVMGVFISQHETTKGRLDITRIMKNMKVYFTVKTLLWHHVQSSFSLHWATLLFSDMISSVWFPHRYFAALLLWVL